MRAFNHVNAKTAEEASEIIKGGGAVLLAGGGDLLGALKDDIFIEYPKTVVNLKSIPGLGGVSVESGVLKIGALTTLAELSRNSLVIENAKVLADAAGKVSSPTLRETTTAGGNVCQLPRCWYFRKLNNRFECARKGGTKCFAVSGDNRYHSIFGGASMKAGHGGYCIAVNQGDLAPVLTVLGAKYVTTERTIEADEFYAADVLSSTVLKNGEILLEIHVPISEYTKKSAYKRFTFRKSIDFPVISVAIAADSEKNYRICIGGAAPVPYRAENAEEVLRGREITEDLAAEAAIAATQGAKPYELNSYKVQLIKTLVKRELIALQQALA